VKDCRQPESKLGCFGTRRCSYQLHFSSQTVGEDHDAVCCKVDEKDIVWLSLFNGAKDHQSISIEAYLELL
jgi:hypothetical protein